jgi:hypothetical protein
MEQVRCSVVVHFASLCLNLCAQCCLFPPAFVELLPLLTYVHAYSLPTRALLLPLRAHPTPPPVCSCCPMATPP